MRVTLLSIQGVCLFINSCCLVIAPSLTTTMLWLSTGLFTVITYHITRDQE